MVNPIQIDNLNIVLKGLWRLSENREESQDFIYKKTWNFYQEDVETTLLKELFTDSD